MRPQKSTWQKVKCKRGTCGGKEGKSESVEQVKTVEGKDRGVGCNSLLSPSPSANLPRTINHMRRQTLIEDYRATGSTATHIHRQSEALNATGSIQHSHTLFLFFLLTWGNKKLQLISVASTLTSNCTVDESHLHSVWSTARSQGPREIAGIGGSAPRTGQSQCKIRTETVARYRSSFSEKQCDKIKTV